VHELNACGTKDSDLYTDGVGNFFLTDLYRYRAQVVIPGPEVQARVAAPLAGRTARRLHEPHYNMVSYVYSTRYQNSNHPFDRRMAGQIDTVTTDAIVGFVRGRDAQARVLVVE
jgi:hypothetical protein